MKTWPFPLISSVWWGAGGSGGLGGCFAVSFHVGGIKKVVARGGQQVRRGGQLLHLSWQRL